MRAFITGGAGFIGRALARYLTGHANSVTVFDTAHAAAALGPPAAEATITGDIRDSAALCSAVERARPDLVIHLAAVHHIPSCESSPATAHETNVVGTLHLLDAISRLPSRPDLVFASSAAVYADTALPITEGSRIDPIDKYGRTKRDAEQLVADYGRRSRQPQKCTTLRIFNVYGRGDTSQHVIPNIISQLRTSSRIVLGRVDVARDFVYISDVVAAIARASTVGGGHRIYNIGTGVEHTVQQVLNCMSALLDRAIEVTEERSLFRPCERQHLVADIHRSREDLGWSPRVTLREGLSRLLRHEGLLQRSSP